MSTPVNTKQKQPHKLIIVRIIYGLIGFISLALGCIGIVLPIIPTVPFFLLTLFCFTKSSKKFHDWFLNSKIYKKHLQTFAKYRAMCVINEMILLFGVSLMLILTMIFVNKLAVTIILNLLLGCKYGYFIFRVKTLPRAQMKALKIQPVEVRK